LEKTFNMKRPSVSVSIFADACCARTFIGWLAGALLAYL